VKRGKNTMSHPQSPPPDRRNVLQWLSLLLGGAAAAALGVPVVGYVLGALIRPREDVWIELGPVSKFTEGTTTLVKFVNPLRQPWDGMTADTAAYVRRLSEKDFQVFAVNCTHLGCPVSWFPQSGLFMCPCHGGVYYENGDRASGPPPHGLYTYPWDIHEGQLRIKGGHLPTLQDTFKQPKNV
jgi:Rieske Fe-S protein